MAKTKATSRTTRSKPAKKPKPAVKKIKTVAAKKRTGTTRRTSAKITRTAPSKQRGRAPAKSRTTAAPQSIEQVLLRKIVDRIRPLFRSPMDGRIKHLVDAVGLDVAVMLMHAVHKRDDAAHREEVVKTLNTLAGRPAPLPHGSWIWHELMTTDVEGSKRFYRELLGWQTQETEMMPGFHYTTFSNNGVDLAGMMAISPEHGELTSGWGVYVKVDDVDAAAEKAERLGGEIVVPAHDIPVGRWAMVKDPGGATICLYRSRS